MSFYQQNFNNTENNVFEFDPITWGDFKITGLKESYNKSNLLSTCFCKLKSRMWHDIILGILTNNFELIKENIDKVDILTPVYVMTNDPNEHVKLFSIKEAEKYSNKEIKNYVRKKYMEKSSNHSSWLESQIAARDSRGSYFSTVSDFNVIRPKEVKQNSFKAFVNPITVGKVQIIGIPNICYPYKMPLQDAGYYSKLNLNLLYAVISGNLNEVKSLVESAPDINFVYTIPAYITNDYNELNVDLPFEAQQLGFTEIAQYLRSFENFKRNLNEHKKLRSAIEHETFDRKDTGMEIEN